MKNSKTLKRLLCAVLVLALALSLSGCSFSSALTAMKSVKAVSKLESFSCDISLDTEVTDYGLPVSASASLKCIREPVQLEMQSSVSLADSSVPYISLYLQSEPVPRLIMGLAGAWDVQELKEAPEIKLDLAQTLGLCTKLADSFSEAGTEKVGSYTARRYDGSLTEDFVSLLMGDSDSEIDFGGTAVTTEQLHDALVGMNISLWIDEESFCPVKLQIDLGSFANDIVSGALSQLMGGIEIGINKAFFTVEVTGLNNVNKIDIPAEALEAIK